MQQSGDLCADAFDQFVADGGGGDGGFEADQGGFGGDGDAAMGVGPEGFSGGHINHLDADGHGGFDEFAAAGGVGRGLQDFDV